MSVVGKLTPHGVEFVESIARKLGYKSADEAEKFIGAKAFSKAVDSEAAKGPRESILPTTAPRQRTPYKSDEDPGTGFTLINKSEPKSAYEQYLDETARRESAKSEFRRRLPPTPVKSETPYTPRGSETYDEELESAFSSTEKMPNISIKPNRKVLAGAGLTTGLTGAAMVAGTGREPTVLPSEEETPDTLAKRISIARSDQKPVSPTPVTPEPAAKPVSSVPGTPPEPETLDQQRDRLLKETQNTIDRGYTPTRSKTKAALDNLKKTVDELPEVDQKKYNSRLEQLDSDYKEYSKRSEWAEVAEMIGQSLVSMGASIAAAKAGVVVDPRTYLRPTDWEARRARRLGEYESAAGRIEKLRAADERENQRLSNQKIGLEEKNVTLAEKEDEATSQAARDKYKAQIDNNLQKIKLIENLQQKLVDEAAKAGEVDKSLRSAQISDIRSEIAKREKELEAGTEASLLLQAQTDLGRKEADKLIKTNATAMARAGVTPEILARINEESTKKGLFWDSIDQDKKNQLIQQYVTQPKQQELDRLRTQLSGILGGGVQSTPTTTAPATPPPATVRVRHKASGETRELTREQASKLPATEFEITEITETTK
jgi:hypothetical protein